MLPGQTPDIASGALAISSWNPPSRIYNFKLYHSYALRLPLWRQPEWSWPVHFLFLVLLCQSDWCSLALQDAMETAGHLGSTGSMARDQRGRNRASWFASNRDRCSRLALYWHRAQT